MAELIKNIFSLMTKHQKRKFYVMQILVLLMAFSELIGIISIAPFMALVGDTSIIEKNIYINKIYIFTATETKEDFILKAGFLVLLILTLSSIFSMFATWKISIYASTVGVEIGDRLFGYYLQKDLEYHLNESSSQLIKKIATESDRIAINLINPLMHLNAKIALSIMISTSIFIYNPKVATIGVLIFSIAYIILYRIVKNRLETNGKILSDVATNRFKLMGEAFGGIREIILYNKISFYQKQFQTEGGRLSLARGSNNALWLAPKFGMELIAFGSMITLILFLILTKQGNISEILPVLALYSLAGFKLLPSFQQIYASYGQIKANLAAFEELKFDLMESKKILEIDRSNKPNVKTSFENSIFLDSIKFAYEGKKQYALNGLTLKIKANTTIGLVGSSGSGKSTLLDILLCLLDPEEGHVYVDDTKITNENKNNWRSLIGYVPQQIFLTEGSICENIAYGIDKQNIDVKRVYQAIEFAMLTDYINSLPYNINTYVGERGVQLSGGQRQRIGIARALYNDPDILILDEATSALDGITEFEIMNSIKMFSGSKTIIMIAHRLETIKNCDIIYFIDDGRVFDKGTYEELICKNIKFANMVRPSHSREF